MRRTSAALVVLAAAQPSARSPQTARSEPRTAAECPARAEEAMAGRRAGPSGCTFQCLEGILVGLPDGPGALR